MSANVEAMVREGVNAFKAGRKDEARALLLKATELDQYNEQAWLWLSGLMDTPDDQRTCLENVLAINPNNERAQQGLSYLTGQTTAGNISPFSANTPPPSVPPSTSSAPTSVEWAAPEEPPPLPGAWNRPPPVEPTPAALDDWVSNLNLPVNDPGTSAALNFSAAASTGSASPFGDFDLNDDDFVSGPFSASPMDVEPEMTIPASPRRSPPPPPPMSAPAPGTRRARLPMSPPEESSMLYQVDQDQDKKFHEEEEGEMFGYIPAEIKATRLPGTRERTPPILTIGIIVLLLLNIGMAIITAMAILT